MSEVYEPNRPIVTEQELLTALSRLPGNDGWWHSDDGDTYAELGKRLVGYGLSFDDAYDVLERAYAAAADEFGA